MKARCAWRQQRQSFSALAGDGQPSPLLLPAMQIYNPYIEAKAYSGEV